MAGQPRKRAMVAELERRAKAADGVAVLEYAADWVGSGKTILQLAQDVSGRLKQGDDYVTRHMLSKYLNGLEGGVAALAEARSDHGAHALADSAIEIVDRTPDSKEEVAANKNAAEMRLKMAGFWNKGEYQPALKNAVNVNLDLGRLHLDALRVRTVPAAVVDPPALPAGPDVEVVSGEG